MSCIHKWVSYTSFYGVEEICCAHAGCGIKKSDYKHEPVKIKNQDYADALSYAQFPILGSWPTNTIKMPYHYPIYENYDEFGHKKPDGKL